jgi:hypothetical protein
VEQFFLHIAGGGVWPILAAVAAVALRIWFGVGFLQSVPDGSGDLAICEFLTVGEAGTR